MIYKIINKKKLIATVILDTFGKAVFAIPNLLFRPKAIRPEQIHSILVVRTAYIGDVVMTLPILQALKSKFPQAGITFLTSRSALPLLENNPYLDAVLGYDPFWFYKSGFVAWFLFIRKLRRQRFDLVIEARADLRDLALVVFFCRAQYKVSYAVGGGGYLLTHVVDYPGLTHKVDYHLHIASYLGCSITVLDGGLYLSASEIERGQKILADNGVAGSCFVVHPGSRLFLKRWPLARCAALCDELIVTYHRPIVFVGALSEIGIIEAIQGAMHYDTVSVAGRISLRELAAVLSQAEVFVCNDSAPMHIAAAMRTPTVAIFGPSKSRETGPYGVLCRVVEKDMPCRTTCDESSCRFTSFHACMEQITVAQVMSAVTELLGSMNSPSPEAQK